MTAAPVSVGGLPELPERDAFEAWYVADMMRQMPGLSIVASEVRALRKGNGYGKDRVMLNGKWEGWQACRLAALSERTSEGWQPIAFSLRWENDPRINLSTVFDTEAEAREWADRCGGPISLVPLYEAKPSATDARSKP